MMDKMINGRLLADLIDLLFKIIELPLRVTYVLIIKVPQLILRKLFSRVDELIANYGRRRVARKTVMDDKSIMFVTEQGEYTCNPKYIAEEILHRKLPYKVNWAVKNASFAPFPQQVNLVKVGSLDYFRTIASSKLVIINGHSIQRNGVYKNDRQIWLQTWHGSLGLKRLEGAGGDDKFYHQMQQRDTEETDYLISNSEFEDKVFSSTYWPNVPILRYGHARNDILFDRSKETAAHLRKKVLKRLNITDKGQKFLLFAPTHNDKATDRSFGNVDFEKLREVLSSKFGGTWEVLIRTHNSNKGKSGAWLSGLPLSCHNASFYPDMQELLMVADVGVTDYSSWICDYILTKKPSFLFGVNIDAYKKTRGFYHKFEDTPFSLATSNEELFTNITKFNQKAYEIKIDAFLKDCVCVDDGSAASRIVDKIVEIMEG